MGILRYNSHSEGHHFLLVQKTSGDPERHRMSYIRRLHESWRGKEYHMKVISTDKAPAAIGPYSQAIVLNDILFTSGQIPINPATGEIEGSDIAAQAEQVMKNLGAVLEEAGTSFGKVVKTTCFLADMGDFATFNEVYAKYFVNKPARSCVAVKTLPKNVLCEVECIAEL